MKAGFVLLLMLFAIASPIYPHPLDEEILTAAADGDRDRIKRLLARGADVNARDVNQPRVNEELRRYSATDDESQRYDEVHRNETPLFKAVFNQDIKTVQLLLKEGARVNLQDDWGETPLLTACIRENKKIVKLLLDAGANPNLQTRGRYSPVMEAAGHKELSLIKLLLSRGARLDVSAESGLTPLMMASRRSGPMLPFLLAKGLNVNAQMKNRETALVLAIQAGRIRNAALLLAVGANPNLKSENFDGPLYYSVAYEGGYSYTQAQRRLLLKMLFKAGAKIGKEADRLLWQTGDQRANYQPENFRLFIKKGAKPGKKILVYLEAAALENNLEIIKFLLHLGANLEKRDSYGMTVLDRLKLKEPNAGIKFLLKKMPAQNIFTNVKRALEGGDTKALAEHIRRKDTSVLTLLSLFDPYIIFTPKFLDDEAAMRSMRFLFKRYQQSGARMDYHTVKRFENSALNNHKLGKRIDKLIKSNRKPAIKDRNIGIYYDYCRHPEILKKWNIEEALKKSPKEIQAILYSVVQCRKNTRALRYLLSKGVPLLREKSSKLLSVANTKATIIVLLENGIPINTAKGGKFLFCRYRRSTISLTSPLFKLYIKRGANLDCPPYRKRLRRTVLKNKKQEERILRAAGVKLPEIELVRALRNKTPLADFTKIHQAGAPIYEDLLFDAVNLNRYDLIPFILKHYVSRRKASLLHSLLNKRLRAPVEYILVGSKQRSLVDYLLRELKFFPDPPGNVEYGQTPLILAVKRNRASLAHIFLRGGG